MYTPTCAACATPLAQTIAAAATPSKIFNLFTTFSTTETGTELVSPKYY